MARNTTLTEVLTEMRAEARLSLDVAHNVHARDGHVLLIQREQQRLWEDFAWPHLRVHRFISLQAGQRYYDPDTALLEDGSAPTLQIPVERIERIEVKSDGIWLPLQPEITAEHYRAHDSALDQRSSPARAWRLSEGEDLEVWPVPDANAGADQEGTLRITGIRALRPLVAESDRTDLDGRLIALYAAGAILAAAGAKDANLKLEAAARMAGRMKGGLVKASDFNMFGTCKPEPRSRRDYVTQYRPPVA